MQLFSVVFQDFKLLSFELGQIVAGSRNVDLVKADQRLRDAGFGIGIDEPAAALDPIAEFEVYNRMNQMIGEKTVIFISHRLSSCRFFNDPQDHEIIVFHEGRLIQCSSHDALVSDRSGMFYRLWNAQAQYYEVKE